MGLMDKIKDAVGKNGDKADGAIDKGAGMADEKTGYKHSDQIESGSEKAKDFIAKLDDDKQA